MAGISGKRMCRKLIYGVGVNDSPYPTEPDKTVNGRTINSRKCPYFVLWKGILRRCYTSSVNENPTYIGCTVDERWHSFMAFKTWMENQKQHVLWLEESDLPVKERKIKFQLDKDLLGNGKLYSPDTCVLIPSTLNSVLSHQRDSTKNLPLGVGWVASRLKYRSYIMIDNKYKSLGYYENVSVAHKAWQNAKCTNILRLLEGYEDQPYADQRIVQSLRKVVNNIYKDIENSRETLNFRGGL